MAETIAALQEEYLSFLKDTQTAYLATVEAAQPRVRPVALLWIDGVAWIGSGASNGKTRQVKQDGGVELCIPIERNNRHGYVRLAGRAEVVCDPAVRSRLAERMPFFDAFWDGPDDARYSLIRIVPREVFYLRPEEDHHHVIDLAP